MDITVVSGKGRVSGDDKVTAVLASSTDFKFISSDIAIEMLLAVIRWGPFSAVS